MWLIFSLILFFVYVLVFGGSGFCLAWITDHVSHGAVRRWLQPRVWVVLTLGAIVALAAKVDALAGTGVAAAMGFYPFFVWWALACLSGGFGFSMAALAALAPDVIEEPRLSGDEPPANLLHVYGQEAWHSDVHIVGSRGALDELRRAVQAALSEPSGVGATRVVFPSDDEGYRVIFVRVDNVAYLKRLGLPYFGEIVGLTPPQGKIRMLLPDELLEAIRHAVRDADERNG